MDPNMKVRVSSRGIPVGLTRWQLPGVLVSYSIHRVVQSFELRLPLSSAQSSCQLAADLQWTMLIALGASPLYLGC